MTLRVGLFCSGGMSTSLIGSKMQKVYDAANRDVKVTASDLSMIDEIGDELDVIIIAPQISWAAEQVKQQHPKAKVVALTMQEFGQMNGQVIVDKLDKEGVTNDEG
ncbi:PTS sugar transporter subunit IIB [Lacticaseibacillus jixianensis]|uniref:PTS sugar transporter subunit IIB n=1 Tax=Lacticaseibacillus jixianensis TaxID=2486012 RepID=A0ABW4BCT9_9LACO|nr:transcription antiterminator [Lacticaseibacillus jixianensis]